MRNLSSGSWIHCKPRRLLFEDCSRQIDGSMRSLCLNLLASVDDVSVWIKGTRASAVAKGLSAGHRYCDEYKDPGDASTQRVSHVDRKTSVRSDFKRESKLLPHSQESILSGIRNA